MASNDRRADPTDLDGLREGSAATDPEGCLAPVAMNRREIGPAVLHLLLEAASGLLAGHGERVVLVGDPTPIPREGKELKDPGESGLAETVQIERAVVGDPRHELHADEAALDEEGASVSGAGCVAVVGSGTISDVCKVATLPARGMPLERSAARGQGYSSEAAPQRQEAIERSRRRRDSWHTVET